MRNKNNREKDDELILERVFNRDLCNICIFIVGWLCRLLVFMIFNFVYYCTCIMIIINIITFYQLDNHNNITNTQNKPNNNNIINSKNLLNFNTKNIQ